MRTIYCLLISLCPYLMQAQETFPANDNTTPITNSKGQTIKPLSVGDNLPEISFTQTLNSKLKTLNTSSFKGKLLLLDFWATWCGSCIKKFNMLDSMQRNHENDMQVILINTTGTGDTKQKLESFFNRHKSRNGSKFSMPAVYNDSIASAYFPHQYIPHYAWIGKDGTCIAITGPDEVTPENIRDVINGNIPQFAGLQMMDSFNFQKPLFLNGNGGNGDGITFRSTWSQYIPGMVAAAGFGRTPKGLITHYTSINTQLLDLIKQAYQSFPRNDRIRFNVNDSLKNILLSISDDIEKKGIYSYELITPPLARQQFFKFMRQDIERCFNITAVNQVNNIPCYTITIDSTILVKSKTKGAKPVNNLYKKEQRNMINRPLSSLVAFLNETLDKPVVLKATTDYNLDISLAGINYEDTGELTKALSKMGIYITTLTQPIELFTINQLPKQQP